MYRYIYIYMFVEMYMYTWMYKNKETCIYFFIYRTRATSMLVRLKLSPPTPLLWPNTQDFWFSCVEFKGWYTWNRSFPPRKRTTSPSPTSILGVATIASCNVLFLGQHRQSFAHLHQNGSHATPSVLRFRTKNTGDIHSTASLSSFVKSRPINSPKCPKTRQLRHSILSRQRSVWFAGYPIPIRVSLVRRILLGMIGGPISGGCAPLPPPASGRSTRMLASPARSPSGDHGGSLDAQHEFCVPSFLSTELSHRPASDHL